MRRLQDVALQPKKYVGKQARLYYWFRLTHRLVPWSLVDDKAFLKYKFHQKLGYPLDLRTPRTFNEKLNWIKLHDRRALLTHLADKYRVREYVEERVGEQYLTHLLGVYEHAEQIDWCSLPDQFVLKVNQGCKSNIICSDKRRLDVEVAATKLDRWLGENGYFPRREWPYKDIPPRIVCEEYLEGDPDWGLLDYKFFCFDGTPTFVAVDFDRFSNHTQYFYDMDWQRQPFMHGLPTPDRDAPRPPNLDTMIEVASTLSEGFPFLRVDLYNCDGRVIFGELTFHPAGSLKGITPAQYDRALGDLIDITRIEPAGLARRLGSIRSS